MILLKKPYRPLMFTGLSAAYNVYGKSFMQLKAVYLSGAPVANTTLHNPFSAVPKLSAHYPAFTAYKLLSSEYSTNFDNTITITVPAPIASGYIDVIAQNPAGYGALTRFVIKEPYSGSQPLSTLRPWALGIKTLSGVETNESLSNIYLFTIDSGVNFNLISNIVDGPKIILNPNIVYSLSSLNLIETNNLTTNKLRPSPDLFDPLDTLLYYNQQSLADPFGSATNSYLYGDENTQDIELFGGPGWYESGTFAGPLDNLPLLSGGAYQIRKTNLPSTPNLVLNRIVSDTNLQNQVFFVSADNTYYTPTSASSLFNNLTTLNFITYPGIPTTINYDLIPELRNLYINNSSLTNFTINSPKLEELYLNTNNLSSLNILNLNTNKLKTAILGQFKLSGYELIDTFLSCKPIISALKAGKYPFPLVYVDIPFYGKTIKNLGRSNASTSALYDILSSVYTVEQFNYGQIEIDPHYPKYQIPTGNYTTTLPGSSIMVIAPVSGTSSVRHQLLSGTYNLVPNILYNNRNIFKNINDYYILYNTNSDLWTLVGPTSTSNTIWLSAVGGAGDLGNIPSCIWSGQAFTEPGWGGAGPWYQGTRVFSTTMLYFSSLRISGTTQLRYNPGPLTAINTNFYWKNLNFSGIGWSGTINQPISPMGHLISPIHFVTAEHFPITTGNTVNFINKDGSTETRTCLSAISISTGGINNDALIGILNAPVSATPYRIWGGNNSIFTKIQTPNDFNKFLYGPTQYGLVGYAQPQSDGWSAVTSPTLRDQIYSVPKSLWHGDRVVGGDSTSPYWYINNNELILIGHTIRASSIYNFPIFPNGTKYDISSPNLLQTFNRAMTALSLQFFGPNTNVYTVSAYN